MINLNHDFINYGNPKCVLYAAISGSKYEIIAKLESMVRDIDHYGQLDEELGDSYGAKVHIITPKWDGDI